MSVIRTPMRIASAAMPVFLTALLFLLAVLFLFAYPLFSAALGLALPFATIAIIAFAAIAMNLRWSMWHGRRPFYFGIGDWGFIACMASFAVYGFATVETASQMLPAIAFGIVLIGLARFAYMEFEAWWLGPALALVLLAIMGQYLLFTLPHLEWFFDFVSSMLLVLSMGLLVAGSLAWHVHSRHPTDTAPPAGRWALRTTAGLAAVLVVVSAVVTVVSTTTVSSADSEGLVVIEAKDGHFEQDWRRNLQVGDNTVVLRNQDSTAHTFTIERVLRNCAQDIYGFETCDPHYEPAGFDVALGPRSARVVTITVNQGEHYRIRCNVPGHTESSFAPVISPSEPF